MEKYSQYRDRGTGIAPFFPIPSQLSSIYLPLHILLFTIRVPILLAVCISYFLVFAWLPIGSLGKKAALWSILGVPGIWWVDLQLDGVKKGSLSRTPPSRLPGPRSIIATSSTSPLDALYLAAIFDPVFAISYPSTRLVQPTSLFSSIVRALYPPTTSPPPASNLMTLRALMAEHPDRPVVIFPECTPTNGRAILSLSPSLLTAPRNAKIFSTSLRYTPADVTTPVPGSYEAVRFLWRLCAGTTHTIRVRIAEAVYNDSQSDGTEDDADQLDERVDVVDELTSEERRVLDRVGEALARLGRVKRVALGVRDKSEFLAAWGKRLS